MARRIRREARQAARAETQPQIRQTRRSIRGSRKDEQAEYRRVRGLNRALQGAISDALGDTKGLGKEFADQVTSELAQRRVDAAAGTAFARRETKGQFQKEREELRAQLSDLLAQKGALTAKYLNELRETARDRQHDFALEEAKHQNDLAEIIAREAAKAKAKKSGPRNLPEGVKIALREIKDATEADGPPETPEDWTKLRDYVKKQEGVNALDYRRAVTIYRKRTAPKGAASIVTGLGKKK